MFVFAFSDWSCRSVNFLMYMCVLLFRLVLPDGVSQFPLCVTHVCWPRGGLLVFCIHGRAGIFLSTVHLPQDSSEEILRLG